MTAATRSTDGGMTPALPIMVVVFLSFLSIGLALPVLPLQVHDVLGFGPVAVGIISGAQFLAALASRFWAGKLADTRGPQRAVSLGMALAVVGGGFYLLSLPLVAMPTASAAALLVGRTLLGGSESLVITGGMLWGIGLAGPERSAKAIAWIGMAMFAALAAGAPLGSAIFARFGFAGIAMAAVLLPILSFALVARVRDVVPERGEKADFRTVVGAVLLPGLGFAFSGITFGAMTAFLTLYFVSRGWADGALAFTVFAVALIAARIIAGHLPDRFGGARVALCSLGVQAIGLVAIGLAASPAIAMVGAAVAGVGFSLVFPSLGLEAVRRVPASGRGMAMGTYNAFLDLTLGIGSPALGGLAAIAGLGAVFIASAVAAVLANLIAFALLRSPAPEPV